MMPGGGACWTNVIAGLSSEMQPFVATIAALAPVMRQQGGTWDGGPHVRPGGGERADTLTPSHPIHRALLLLPDLTISRDSWQSDPLSQVSTFSVLQSNMLGSSFTLMDIPL